MNEFVHLFLKRNRGWPWPGASWGLDSMYGQTGWCHACGVPLHEQTGALTLGAAGQSPVHGAWIPNWQFNAICLEKSLAERVSTDFHVDLRPVAWHKNAIGAAIQIVAHPLGSAWFDTDELRDRTIARHGTAGNRCAECGVWRWFPLPYELLPPIHADAQWEGHDVLASPEWFGDGKQSFREILVRRALAELIAEASPKDFKIEEASLIAPATGQLP